MDRSSNTPAILACLTAALLLASTASCSKTLREETEDSGPVLFSSGNMKGAIGSGQTYRIMTYVSAENQAKYSFNEDGTYYLKNPEDTVLTPCAVSADGTYSADDPEARYKGAGGDFIVTAVSPGIEHNGDGTFDFMPSKDIFFVSYPQKHSLTGSSSIKIAPLKDCRSKISFRLYRKKGSHFESLEIGSPMLLGAGAEDRKVTYYPASRQVAADMDANIGIRLEARQDEQDAAGNSLLYESGEIYVASAIYAPLDKTMEVLNETYKDNLYKDGSYLFLVCDLLQDGRIININLPLTASKMELLPMHRYTFKLIIASDYIELLLDVASSGGSNGWDEVGNGGEIIEDPAYTVSVGTWEIVGNDNGWELIRQDEQIIG